MAATSKTALLAITQKEFDKLELLLDTVTGSLSRSKDDADTSIKDVVGHRAHWIGLFLGWYTDGRAGKTVYFPAAGFKWNELARYNAQLREQQAKLTWPAARAALRDAHAQLLAFLHEHSEQELYGGPMQGANNAWTTGRWAEAAGASHYRSAARYVRARLRQG